MAGRNHAARVAAFGVTSVLALAALLVMSAAPISSAAADDLGPADSAAATAVVATTPPTTADPVVATVATGTGGSLAGRSVLVVGDSLVFTASDALQREFDTLGADATIVSYPGTTIEWSADQLRRAARHDIVVVATGTNNTPNGWDAADHAEATAAVTGMERHGCGVWIIPTRWRHGTPEGPESVVDRDAAAVVDGLAQTLEDTAVTGTFWDSLAANPLLHVADGVHHTDAGSERYARFISDSARHWCATHDTPVS